MPRSRRNSPISAPRSRSHLAVGWVRSFHDPTVVNAIKEGMASAADDNE